jgi:glycine/D-amino acid oxidase-like deaminating enzyme
MMSLFKRPAEARSRPLAGLSTWQRHGGAPGSGNEAGPAGGSAGDLPPKADFVVVGGGLAGLSTALAMATAEPMASIVVLESKFVGFGASGRNAGLLGPLPAPLWLASAASVPEHLWGLGHLNRRVHETARWLAAEAPGGCVEPRALRIEANGLLTEAGLARVAGLLDKARLAYRTAAGPRGRLAIDLDTHTVDPYRTVRALAALARRRGIAIHESTPVAAVEESAGGVEVCLADGRRLAARAAVVCTNAYSGVLDLAEAPKAKVVYNYMVATNPFVIDRLVRPGAEGRFVVELNTAYVYYRIHRQRVVYGGIERFTPSGESDFDVPSDVLAGLERLLDRSFPGVGLVPEEAWGGIYHQTATDLPILKRVGQRGAVVLNVGYGGTGVAMTLICGRIAAGLARGGRFADPDDGRLLAAIEATRFPVAGIARFVAGVAGDVVTRRRPAVPDRNGG